ncbi:MAG: TRAP transporter permease [Hoeflea sp.]|uniref:TRAP transporter permease n=1 Tax=Hoeflea sp. TaxID=1940281 RepID=UPI001E137919|nr:TRAP transporter permease [Hoeflea sp.]MBU4528998.1 TRAP transporter permease [Alphaproteobacteria bacterium]MBU4543403.1 TRAP transporter permease [Alphaproteobacteria bacterium]MBU4549028.1 TRAP transporter permease [Alphaproteobacteria bacterium]MBV1725163.1 TRAP transporter permease [Hoeflea sp.]MBV1785124.1 TRAP transporter permease [Hoeflea sp.]
MSESEASTRALELEFEPTRKRSLAGMWAATVTVIAVLAAAFHIYALGISSPGVQNLRAIHLLLGFLLVPLLYAGWKGAKDQVNIVDLGLIAVGMACTAYYVIEGPNMVWRYGVAPTQWDIVFGTLSIALILEITRRALGWALVIVIAVFMAYAMLGSYFPGPLVSRSFSFERTVSFLFSIDGIYGIPLGVSSTYVYLFILFGAMLRLSRAGDFYMELAYAIAGRARGGPAKVSIFSSALFGTISGTGIANVVTTGTMTIPLMIRTGLKPRFAAAVEAVASTGGQFMPPVMGAGAFLMAEFVRIPYGSIIVSATLPALLFFLSVYLIVDIQAAKQGLKGLPADELPKFGAVIKRWGHLALPLAVLVYMLIVEGSSPIRAALFAMGTTFIVSWLRVESRLGFKRLLEAARDGSTGALEVITACAAAGIIVGLFSLTGIGLRMSGLVVQFSGGIVLVALILTAIITIILSMGLPATAAYIVSAAVIANPLITMGVDPLAAHLFIFYFACLSGITPPVALVAFPAGSIAGVNPVAVGITAFRLALVAFIIPFMFAYAPELLLRGEWYNVIIVTITAVIGVWSFASAMGGWLLGANLAMWLRLALGAGALALIFPGLVTDAAGLALVAFACIVQSLANRRTATGV